MSDLFQEFTVGQREEPVEIRGTRDVPKVEYVRASKKVSRGYVKQRIKDYYGNKYQQEKLAREIKQHII